MVLAKRNHCALGLVGLLKRAGNSPVSSCTVGLARTALVREDAQWVEAYCVGCWGSRFQ
jgi:hypothetical protein